MSLVFCFDFVSPYAYLAACRLPALVAEHDVDVELRPVLLSGLLNAHGQLGPAEIPPKRLWVFKEAARRAALAGVPFGLPHSHPFNPLLALRAVLAAPAEARPTLCTRLWAEVWGGEATGGLQDPAVVAARADQAGLDGGALVQEATSSAVKRRLRELTEDALRQGAFGVPTLFVGDELFWGYDALDPVDLHLRGQDPLPVSYEAAVAALPSSASRL